FCMLRTITLLINQERENALDSIDGYFNMQRHQENVAFECQGPAQPARAAHVVQAGPPSRPEPKPASPPPPLRPDPNPAPPLPPQPPPSTPKPKMQQPAEVLVPPALYKGLNENLQRLLQEGHVDE